MVLTETGTFAFSVASAAPPPEDNADTVRSASEPISKCLDAEKLTRYVRPATGSNVCSMPPGLSPLRSITWVPSTARVPGHPTPNAGPLQPLGVVKPPRQQPAQKPKCALQQLCSAHGMNGQRGPLSKKPPVKPLCGPRSCSVGVALSLLGRKAAHIATEAAHFGHKLGAAAQAAVLGQAGFVGGIGVGGAVA